MKLSLLAYLGAPLGLLALTAAIPIIVLFLLRRRRRDVQVSSTLLWARVFQETQARQPFRRPREWLSLLLLLLATVAVAMALADLRHGSGAGRSDGLIVVLDASASMATATGDGSRFDRAVEGVRAAVSGAAEGVRITVIVAGGAARVLVHGQDDLDVVSSALKAVRVEPVTGELAPAIDLAVQHGREEQAAGRSARVLVFSDLADDPDALAATDLGGVPVTLIRCGDPIQNAGITAVALSGTADGSLWLNARVARSGAAGARTATLHLDGRLLDARVVSGDPGEEVAVVFPVTLPQDEDAVQLSVRLDPPDAFTLDDAAWIGANRRPPASVLVVGGRDPFLERLPDVFPGSTLEVVSPADLGSVTAATSRPFDLVIYTEPAPEPDLPPALAELWMGCVPDGSDLLGQDVLEDPVVLDWDRMDPLLRDVGFEELLILRSASLRLPAGAQSLVRLDGGVQLARLPSPGGMRYLWASTPADSNLLLQPAFPLLVRNLLRSGASEWEGHAHAAARPLHVPAGLDRIVGMVDLTCTASDGTSHEAHLWSREEWVWPGHPPLGMISARSRGEAIDVVRPIGVSLLSLAETTRVPLAPDALLKAGVPAESTSLSAWSPEAPRWTLCALLAALLLAGEAWLWSRGRG